MNLVTVDSYAKINLFLRVTSKRTDGFHDLTTLFCGIDIRDNITVTEAAETKLHVEGADISAGEDNIIIKTDTLLRKTHKLPNFDIVLKKNIPVGSGLGGGSGNAYGYIRAIGKYLDLNFDKEPVYNILSEIGSDTAFFMDMGLAVGTGRGEVLEKIDILEPLYFVICYPNIYISTKKIFDSKKLSLTRREDIPNIASRVLFDDICGLMVNDLEGVVFDEYPRLLSLKKAFLTAGAESALLTGSGSSVFGVFRDDSTANSAKDVLAYKYKDYRFWVAKAPFYGD
jgi:4-diphosphocytidyl-2-C-methyl-D-erythritol kinase